MESLKETPCQAVEGFRKTAPKHCSKHPDQVATTKGGFSVLHTSFNRWRTCCFYAVPGARITFFFYEPESFVITELMFVGTYVWISHMHMCKIKQYPIFHYLTTTGHPLE